MFPNVGKVCLMRSFMLEGVQRTISATKDNIANLAICSALVMSVLGGEVTVGRGGVET